MNRRNKHHSYTGLLRLIVPTLGLLAFTPASHASNAGPPPLDPFASADAAPSAFAVALLRLGIGEACEFGASDESVGEPERESSATWPSEGTPGGAEIDDQRGCHWGSCCGRWGCWRSCRCW